jgi:hypothetical protein
VIDAAPKPPNPRRRRIERRHHKAEKLPREVRDELAKRFQAGETYDRLVAWLAEKGYTIGRSSVHRWGARFQKHLEKLRAWREAAQTIVADLSGKPATELNEAAEQSAVQLLFELVIDLQSAGAGESDEAPLDLKHRSEILSTAAHALANLGHSAAGRERLKIAFKKEFALEAAKKIADAVGDAKVGGRSVVETVREALGIA